MFLFINNQQDILGKSIPHHLHLAALTFKHENRRKAERMLIREWKRRNKTKAMLTETMSEFLNSK